MNDEDLEDNNDSFDMEYDLLYDEDNDDESEKMKNNQSLMIQLIIISIIMVLKSKINRMIYQHICLKINFPLKMLKIELVY